MTDVAAAHELDLYAPMALRISTLVAFPFPLEPWYPSSRLTIEDLSEHMKMNENPIPFWRGAKDELTAEEGRLEKKRAAAQRAAAKGAMDPKAKPATRAKGGTRKRNEQRPPRPGPMAALEWEPPEEQVEDAGEKQSEDDEGAFRNWLDDDGSMDASCPTVT